ncbi:MAG: O-antigen ligase family protein [Cyanobacteria bacterium J06635_1]
MLRAMPQITSLLRYLILFLSGLLILIRWRSTLRTIQKGSLLLLLIGFTMISFMWSDFPQAAIESIRGEVLLFTVFSIYFASRFSPREQLRLLAITLGIGALLSLFYVFAMPDGKHVGDKFDGAWKGVYGQKNSFSGYMTLTLATFFVLGSNNVGRFERLVARFFLILSVAMIILSTSKTGLIVFVTLLLLLLAYGQYRWQGKRTVFWVDALSLFLVTAGSYLFGNWELIITGLGRDPTLTGRTVIWNGAISRLGERLWIGFGRESFWLPENPNARGFSGLGDIYMPAHAHNGFVDIIVDLGLLGLIIFMVGFLLTLALSLKRSYQAKTPEDLWPIALMLLLVFCNISESFLMKRANLFWVLYMVNFLSLRLWPRSSLRKA